MKTFDIRKEHLQRGVVILIIAGFLFWYGIPWFYNRNEFVVPQVEHGPHQQFYKSNGSLKFRNRHLYLNHDKIRILSGAMHYFRVVPEYWKDWMLKMKACGLNTLETYVSWNLHEPNPGEFHFDGILNVREYIKMAKEVGLYVIFRPGPYICSEWDFGGMPSWLLADPNMKLRSNYKLYMDAVERFFAHLLPLVKDLQFVYGGPIIAVQVENEFGSYSSEIEHLLFVKQVMQKNGIRELFLTSDGWNHGKKLGMAVAPFYKHALPTANFKEFTAGKKIFEFIESVSSDFPLMVMEFWSGWFDHWGGKHKGSKSKDVVYNLQKILDSGASVNFYMFHGGTNFGFMAGANYFVEMGYKPDVTSYDYDAPISEAGDCTDKYHKIREVIIKSVLEPQGSGAKTMDKVPADTEKSAYGKYQVASFMSWNNMVSYLKLEEVESESIVPMEMLKRSNGLVFQQYGYILYRKKVTHLQDIVIGATPKDRMMVLVNGVQKGFYNFTSVNGIKIHYRDGSPNLEDTLELLVENLGRVNYDVEGSDVLNTQRKGLSGQVTNNLEVLKNWKIYPLDFRDEYLNRIAISEKYQPLSGLAPVPGLLQLEFTVNGEPKDTFLSMKGWGKGIVIINRHNLGRYWEIGPQKTLFVPAPFLHTGVNQVLIFEEYKSNNEVYFVAEPNLSGN